MNLLQIRKQFVKQSGRYDLVKDQEKYEDDGADFFIRAGQKFLDTLLDKPKSSAVHEETLSAGDFTIKLGNARAIKNVYFSNDDGVEYLIKKSLKWLREEYGEDSQLADVDQGTPAYYSLSRIRKNNTDDEEDSVKKGIIFMPPTDKEITLHVEGLFFSPELKENSDVNWWTETYPHTMVQAGLYMLERFYRNSQGMRDHLEAILKDLEGIDFDVVEEEIAGTDIMDDSFDITEYKRRRDYGIGNPGHAPPV